MKINIGGQKGKNKHSNSFKNWTMVDIREDSDVVVDIMESPLPFNDLSINAIYTSHTFEHIFPDRIPFVLKECNRVLKKDSKIRIVVPDIDKIIKAYVEKDSKYLRNKNNPTKLDCLPDMDICHLSSWFFTYKTGLEGNDRLVGGHVMSFNYDLMKYYLKKSGFRNIKKYSFNKCSSDFDGCDFSRYKNCSLYIEAQK